MMKTLIVEQPKQHKYLFLFMGGLFLFQGIINLVGRDSSFDVWLGSIQVLASVFYLYYSYSLTRPNSIFSAKIILEEESITLDKGVFYKRKLIPVKDIKLIQLKPETLSVMLNEFDFTYSFGYECENKNQLRDLVTEYSFEKGIPVERVSYN